jgi:hypothetical protein
MHTDAHARRSRQPADRTIHRVPLPLPHNETVIGVMQQ